MKIDLSGRVALITGGSGTIGRAVCAYLARAGATIVAACVETDMPNAKAWQQKAAEEGVSVELAAFDVTSFEDAKATIVEIERRHGKIDMLINLAGITRDATLHKMTSDQWNAVINVDLNSVFNCARHVIDGMSERGWGRIINVSSVNGQRGQFGQVNYSAAKAGVHGFTMALAAEVARKGITVNTVAPGYVDSPMIMAVPEKIREGIKADIPMGRFANAEDIAAAITFLCSEQAAYITGVQLPVNGGYYFSA